MAIEKLLPFIFVTGSIIAETSKPQCTGKVTQERSPLFVQAEKLEQVFIEALFECKKNDSCKTCSLFAQTAYETAICLLQLTDHLATLEQGKEGSCNRCERTETKDLKNRLTQLLNTQEARYIMLHTPRE